MGELHNFIYSAPGKIHFLGEHTVVYGKPALLAAINLRVKVTITPNSKFQTPNSSDEIRRLKEIVEKVIVDKFKLKKLPAYSVSIDSQIPIGAGLGSSAAVSAAYIAALLDFLKIKFNLELVNELAYEAEKVFNGNPSGGDNTTVVYGGFIWYRKELDFLKTFKPLPFKLHKNIKQFLLIDSGKPIETTAEMVGKVRNQLQVTNNKLQKIFNDQELLVKELAVALKEGNEDELVEIIKKGEANLEKLGVVGKKAQKIIREVEKIGGAAKIIGGGGVKDGSGMLLSYIKDKQKLKNLAKANNWKITSVLLGYQGLIKES